MAQTNPVIRKLSPLIANQIAAGEVVERPASVVKELLENSIDAGADRIQIDLERGGVRLIRISDNGCGIAKEQLALALSRHATSKIRASEDLAAIGSLGFRGEALASISSVSRLTISSKPEDQEIGWSAFAEGNEMEVKLQPNPLPFGTITEVKDLFFNTPARQKFLRAERTEFVHIEEIVKRIALASPNVAITLKHNGKVVKRIPAAVSAEQQKQRVASILGRGFIGKALNLQVSVEDLQISGWVSPVDFHLSSSLSQYFFVNGRAVKDRTINHAVRQAYQGLLPPGRNPAYALYLELGNDKVDVNVHPTKHEVRFTDGRRVHDFIAKSIATVLDPEQRLIDAESITYQPDESEGGVPLRAGGADRHEGISHIEQTATAYQSVASAPSYTSNHTSVNGQKNYSANRKTKNGDDLIAGRFYLEQQEQLYLLDLAAYFTEQTMVCLEQEWQQQQIKQRMLLMPIRLQLSQELSETSAQQLITHWKLLGVELAQAGPTSFIARKIPSCLEHINREEFFQQLLDSYQNNLNQSDWENNFKKLLKSAWQPQPPSAEFTGWSGWLANFNWKKSSHCYVFSPEKFTDLVIAGSLK